MSPNAEQISIFVKICWHHMAASFPPLIFLKTQLISKKKSENAVSQHTTCTSTLCQPIPEVELRHLQVHSNSSQSTASKQLLHSGGKLGYIHGTSHQIQLRCEDSPSRPHTWSPSAPGRGRACRPPGRRVCLGTGSSLLPAAGCWFLWKQRWCQLPAG